MTMINNIPRTYPLEADTLNKARALVQVDLIEMDKFINARLASPIPLINDMLQHILSAGGKRIRPLLLLLTAYACGYKEKRHIDLASVIELIHTATLLHDDVVDNAALRRGHQTTNAIWGNEASVLVGDFIYSRSFQIVVNLKNEKVLTIFADATHYIAEGEIMQLMNCHNPDTSEDFYYDIISRKTAKLFEVAAELAGEIALASPKI